MRDGARLGAVCLQVYRKRIVNSALIVVVVVVVVVIRRSGRPSLILLVFRCQLARAWSARPDDH